jgi:hypothetical protein
MKKTTTYLPVQVQLVGNLESFGYAFYFDLNNPFKNSDDAFSAGIKELGHDDFIVGEFEDEKCVAVHLYSRKERHDKNSKDFGHYVQGINDELGIES